MYNIGTTYNVSPTQQAHTRGRGPHLYQTKGKVIWGATAGKVISGATLQQ
jgi:hypothetical protein